jgi:hypothetical protein
MDFYPNSVVADIGCVACNAILARDLDRDAK